MSGGRSLGRTTSIAIFTPSRIVTYKRLAGDFFVLWTDFIPWKRRSRCPLCPRPCAPCTPCALMERLAGTPQVKAMMIPRASNNSFRLIFFGSSRAGLCARNAASNAGLPHYAPILSAARLNIQTSVPIVNQPKFA